MLQTPLHKFHLEHDAKMVEFAGWEMPMLYSGIHQEHHQVRSSGGIFDVSHMGRVKFKGRHARRLLERLCSRRISDMQIGQCRYSLMCNEQGGVRDDVLVYRMDDDEFLVVVNASNREKLLEHFETVRAASDYKVTIEDRTLKTAMIAIQGPAVMDLIGKVSSEIPTLKRYRFIIKNLLVMKILISRTGYTGEDGIEAIVPAGSVDMVIKMLLKDTKMANAEELLKPAGLGARDTLRLEAGMPLYGHELGEDINALSCGIDFAITLDKDQDEQGEVFIGMEALKKTRDNGGPDQKLVGILIEGKRTPRQGMAIKIGDAQVGIVTSGCHSPTLDRPIAMGFVDTAHIEPGTRVQIDAGRAMLEGTVTPLPFYKKPKK